MRRTLSTLVLVFVLSAAVFADSGVLEKLKQIPVVSNIQKMDMDFFEEYYQFWYEQPMDHNDPAKGTSKQKVLLGHKKSEAPVITELGDYTIHSVQAGELAQLLQENQLTVEKIVIPNCRLKNFYRIGDGVFRSDQPSYVCFRELEKFGIKEVLNLRNRHNDNDEARGTNIRLHRLRTKASRIKPDDLIEALKIIRDRQGPILIHCWHGSDRTGAVCAMYRIIFQGIDKEQAIHEMVDGLFGFHMIFDDIIDVIDQIDVNAIRQELNLYL